ncbi:N-acetylmuramoyl-L-alanine amidase [Caminicella sporogenes]|uniref:N-acetylmuramoyl-L-alanine amidase n=1 Tax=Caminicella sporogenes TaxID=166485 RepID=UPI0025425BEB|nr:N-acetylmuramoyl-L-alanine amidase [Caminicella sporogenes]WIF95774.1 N-acetylmuramoyl-L-alanine amidase [Caminicella sporogenes]
MEFKNANLTFDKLHIVSLKEKEEIIVHHPAAYFATPEQIHQWHKERGWSGAGYHVYIRKSGEVYILRPINTAGAHCKGHNRKGIGVCFEGNFSDWNPRLKIDKEMNPKQFEAGVEALVKLCKQFKIPVEKIYPHNKFAKKDCPGKYFPFEQLINTVGIKLQEKEYHWAQKDFEKLKADGIITSDHDLNSPLTWGEFSVVINRIRESIENNKK